MGSACTCLPSQLSTQRHEKLLRRSNRASRTVTRSASTQKEEDTFSRIYRELKEQYKEVEIRRVLDSLEFASTGQEYTRFHPGKGLQKASSYISGLLAEPFHDLSDLNYLWMRKLEENFSDIQGELAVALSNPELSVVGQHVWVQAARAEAVAYGPDWKTLVLQDRCVWEDTNCALFPKTVELLKTNLVPSVEVFFAKQAPNTGIKPHTDNTNFILTSHLGLDVPEGECWMKVGEFKKEWKNGQGMIADTSFVHSTANESEVQTRYVLIIRFWHPELTTVERCALQFLFDALADPSDVGISAAVQQAKFRQEKSCQRDKKKRTNNRSLGLLEKGMK